MSDKIRPLRIPVDGALSALRARMRDLGKRADASTWAREWLEASAALECLAMAVEQAQAAERAAHPLHVVTADVSIEARAKAACLAFWRDDDPAFWDTIGERCKDDWRNAVRAADQPPDDTTPEGVLRRVAALVKLLPADRPELWCALPVDAVARLPGATVDTQPRRGEPGKVLHVARAHVDGLLVVGLETREGSVSS